MTDETNQEKRDPRFAWLRNLQPAAFRWKQSGGEWSYGPSSPVHAPTGFMRVRRMYSGKQMAKAFWHGVKAAGGVTPEDDPMARIAGEQEYASWREVMLLERDLYCPDGQRHNDEPLEPSTGYVFRCRLCDHHSMWPF